MVGTDLLAAYHRRYGAAGLMRRYAAAKQRGFWYRQALLVFWCLAVGILLSPLMGCACLGLGLVGDVIDTLVVRPARCAPVNIKRLRIQSSLSAALHGGLFSLSACLPLLAYASPEGVQGGLWSPVLTICILTSTAVASSLHLPLNVSATVCRLLSIAGVALGFVVLVMPHPNETWTAFGMDLVGVLILCGTLVWLGLKILERQDRNRRSQLKTAQQQQELAAVNARLCEQEKAARQLATVAECANDSVILMGRQGEITWVNDSFTRITGYSSEEAVGSMPGDLLNSVDTCEETLAKLSNGIKTTTPVRVEICNKHKDGHNIWLDTSQVPLVDSTGALETLIAVERDITDAKKYEQELQQARVAAEEGARVKSEYFATMSHEIRTPLNGVIGMAQLLEQSPLNTEQREYADTILNSARSLLHLINDILDLSRLEAQEMELSCEDFDLRRCLENCVRLLGPLAADKGIALRLDLAPDLLAQLHGDDRRLTQILMNIVGNAIKFTDIGEVMVTARTIPSPQGVQVKIAVIDTGIGIPEDKVARIFERFSQADAAISRKFGGTGLGLTIAQNLAHAMGGEISVTSQLRQGSTFEVSVHLQPAVAQPRPAVAPPLPQDLSALRILIAEDNQVNRFLVDKFLKSTNAERRYAFDGAQAIEMAQDFQPDVILMDMSMPEVNGLEATRAIRLLPLKQPYIIALTANAFDEDRTACLQAGMDDFLTKPVNRAELLARISQFYSARLEQQLP